MGPTGIFSNIPPIPLIEGRVLIELKISPTDPTTARDVYSSSIDKYSQLITSTDSTDDKLAGYKSALTQLWLNYAAMEKKLRQFRQVSFYFII